MARFSLTGLIRGSGAPLLWRVFAFLAVFIVASGIIGPQIIGAGYVGRDGFAVYGGAGKALLFGALVFMILFYRSRRQLNIPKWQKFNLLWLAGSAVALMLAIIAAGKVISGAGGFWWPVLTHSMILSTVCLGLLAAFGLNTLNVLTKTYWRELRTSAALGVGFVIFLYLVYSLWHILATAVMHAVAWLLSLSGLKVFVIPPQTLLLDKFGIAISQYCSGIDSIALFTGLYILIGILDWQRINRKKYLIAFLPALLILFGFNILRVYGLIMAGYHIDTHIAFSLFHTYAGMIFFIIYSAIFWRLSYRWMLDTRGGNKDGSKDFK